MKRWLPLIAGTLTALFVFTLQSHPAQSAKVDLKLDGILQDLYGFTGIPEKDPCGIDWKIWYLKDGSPDPAGPVAYYGNHEGARMASKTIDAQRAAYKLAKTAGDWDACRILTPYTWVEVRMLKSKAYVALVAWRAWRTQEGTPNPGLSYDDVKDLYETAQALIPMAEEKACDSRSTTKAGALKRMKETRAEIQRELQTLDCIVGKADCPE